MQSKTSSFKRGRLNGMLLRKNLTRFWPLWALYTAVWLILLPLTQFTMLFGGSAVHYAPHELQERAYSDLLTFGGQGGTWIGLIFGCLFAMALFSYLCSARSVGMMHSFPIRREGLFAASYFSGIVVFLGAQAAAYLLTAVVQGAAGVLSWNCLLVSFACAAGQMLFFYSFACFCAMFTGQILALPAFYVILNGLAMGVSSLVQNFATVFFYGYEGGGTPAWVVWLTPALKLFRNLQVDSDWNDALQYSYNYRMGDPACVAVYAAVGVAFAALALLVYRSRRSETAGDTITVNWVKPVFCYGVAVCCALSLGQGLYYLVWEQFRSAAFPSLLSILVCMAITGLIGFFAAKMLLMKSFRVFRGSWKGALILVAALVVFGISVSRDLTGVVHRVPESSTVQSLEFSIGGQNYCSGTTENPDLIEQFREAHQRLIENKDTELQRESEDQYAEGTSSYDYCYVTLTYHLNNGSSVQRSYNVTYLEEDLQDVNGAVAKLAALVQEPEVQRINLLGTSDMSHITSGEMQYYTAGGYADYTTFDGETAQKLYDAMCRDIDAGHFGVNQFDYERWNQETYANDLTLYYSTGEDSMDSCSVSFSDNCTNLIAALKAAGIVDGDHQLVTYQQLDDSGEKTDQTVTVPAAEAPAAAEILSGADEAVQTAVN